jgi:membrane protease YdiL (CAAX protease family)
MEDPSSGAIEPAERRLRLFELALVMCAVFLRPTITALYQWWSGGNWVAVGEHAVTSVHRLADAGVAICLVAYVLARRQRSLAEIGLTFRWSDVLWVFPLWFGCEIGRMLLNLLRARMLTASPHAVVLSARWLEWLAVIPDAAREELVVRAFLMTEIEELTGHMGLAIVASVGLQTLYHLYQGTPAALVHIGIFLVSALFYAATRRITPIILVHALFNLRILAG